MEDGCKFCTQSMQHLSNVKPVWGKCKLSLWRVCILWICEFNKNHFLLVTTKSNKENIHCVGKGSIPSFLNNGRHVSRLLDFVIIQHFMCEFKMTSRI